MRCQPLSNLYSQYSLGTHSWIHCLEYLERKDFFHIFSDKQNTLEAVWCIIIKNLQETLSARLWTLTDFSAYPLEKILLDIWNFHLFPPTPPNLGPLLLSLSFGPIPLGVSLNLILMEHLKVTLVSPALEALSKTTMERSFSSIMETLVITTIIQLS